MRHVANAFCYISTCCVSVVAHLLHGSALQDFLCNARDYTNKAICNEACELKAKPPAQVCRPYFIDNDGKTPPPVGPYESGLRRRIERINASQLTRELFYKWYVHPNRAVVISGGAEALFEDFPSAWTPDALMESPHSLLKQPVRQEQARVASDSPDGFMNVKEIFTQPSRTILFDKYEFGLLQSTPSGQPNWLLQQTYFHKYRATNEFLNTSLMTDTFNLHLSIQGGTLPHSHTATLNLCMFGAKRWIMVDPFDYTSSDVTMAREQMEMMDVWNNAAIGVTSQEWFLYNASKQLEELRIPYHDFILEAGEAIYIPKSWTHATMDMCRETVGVELKGHIISGDYIPEGAGRFHARYTDAYIDPYAKVA